MHQFVSNPKYAEAVLLIRMAVVGFLSINLVAADCTASQAMVLERPVAEMLRVAELVVVGRVSDIESKWDAERRYIYTDVKLTISETLGTKASLNSTDVTFRVLGGTVGDITMRSSTDPTFAAGDEILAILSRDAQSGNFVLTDLVKSAFWVTAGTVRIEGRTLPLSEFKAQVQSILPQR